MKVEEGKNQAIRYSDQSYLPLRPPPIPFELVLRNFEPTVLPPVPPSTFAQSCKYRLFPSASLMLQQPNVAVRPTPQRSYRRVSHLQLLV